MSKEKTNVPDPSQDNWKRDCYDWLQMLTFVLVAVVMVFTFFGMVNSVVGSSMYPTLHDKDIMLAYRLGYTPSQGDVVVIRKESFMPLYPRLGRARRLQGDGRSARRLF